MTSDPLELILIAAAYTIGFVGLTSTLIAEIWGGAALPSRARRLIGVSTSYANAGVGRVVAITISAAILAVMEWTTWLQLAYLARIGIDRMIPTLAHVAAAVGWCVYLAWAATKRSSQRAG